MCCCEALVHGLRRLPTSPTGKVRFLMRGCWASVSRKGTVASTSIAEGSTGTTTASATSRKCASSAPCAPAAASTTTTSASPGSLRSQSRRVPSSGSTACSICARFSAQCRDDHWRSASTSTVRLPSLAKCAARLVESVVLPTPPLELATSTVFIRTAPLQVVEPGGYTGLAAGASARGRPAAGEHQRPRLLAFGQPARGRGPGVGGLEPVFEEAHFAALPPLQ